ncbi:ATP-dependent RNA helicase DDX24 isoform X2 [Lingula anatina]|uniref:RNA helicase n=1 Tax=Lingula anatina TaxID=7574 RepID=A0A1S3JSY0_LINAN|nr:ATP-dependent RNA helicase DDX24 isoform X2 [Lingula anatina]|eukprot:XP_013413231.1 ATP-dependent RNA helicase DDX24 isoform X2 [Lingula anatina]
MATTIKTHGEWKPVKIDPSLFAHGGMEGFICMEELTDYKLIRSNSSKKPGDLEKKKKTTKKEKKDVVDKKHQGTKQSPKTSGKTKSKSSENKNLTIQHAAQTENTDKKKKKKKQKNKNTKQEGELQEKEHKIGRGQFVSGAQIFDACEEDQDEKTEKKQNKLNTSKNKGNENKKKFKPEKRRREAEEQIPKKKLKITEEEQKEDVTETKTDVSAWKDLFVPEPVLEALAELGFSSPTPIQALALPSAIRDRMDIVGAAETGSGKTLAFGIPILHHILKSKSLGSERSTNNKDGSDSEEEEDSVESEDKNNDTDNENNEKDEEEGVVDEEGSDDDDDDVDELGESDSELSEDGSFDRPPGDEDDELPVLKEDDIGCVKILNDVQFDWLEPEPQQAPALFSPRGLEALILTPTRELAVQVKQHLVAVSKYTDIQIAVVVGGMSQQKQERLLKKRPEIVVATPGRLWELIKEGDPHLSTVDTLKYLVIDEADRMVEKGHFAELSSLLEMINSDQKKKKKRQTFVFSATLTLVHSVPQRLLMKKKKKKFKMTQEQKLESLMADIGIKEKPKIIDLTRKTATAERLVETRIPCSTEEKDAYLYYFLHQYLGRTLVFTNSIDCIRRLASIFTLLKCKPLTLHANMHQRQRLKNLERFAADKHGLLLATDVAARGLDIPNVEHVIHYQVPRTSENYIHRSGRTARASKEGLSVMLMSPEDVKNYKKIVHTLNRDEDVSVFPVEQALITSIKSRLNLVKEIDREEHRCRKDKSKTDWFRRAAEEMDIELDDVHIQNDIGNDGFEQAKRKRKIKQMRAALDAMLKVPLTSRDFSGKYPTKMGKLVTPVMPDISSGASALKAVKKSQPKKISTAPLSPNKPKKQIKQKPLAPNEKTERRQKRSAKTKSKRNKFRTSAS